MKNILLVVFILPVLVSLSNGGMYPECWIKNVECLDGNVGPLIEAVKPQINHNIVKHALMNVMSLDDCAQQCFNETECRQVINNSLNNLLSDQLSSITIIFLVFFTSSIIEE